MPYVEAMPYLNTSDEPAASVTIVRRKPWLAALLVPVLMLSACASLKGGAGQNGQSDSAMMGPPPRATTLSVAKPLPPQAALGAAGDLPGPRSRNWTQFKLLAAQRIVAINPALTYEGVPPENLLATPVLQIELDEDGRVLRIEVLRYPQRGEDTVDLAMDAVRRAAPFGDMSQLPRPWKFTESFLFNEARKFKPRTLDR